MTVISRTVERGSMVLTARVRLSDVNLTDAHSAVWNEWLDGHRPPLRACVRGVLPRPEMLVEIMVSAVR